MAVIYSATPYDTPEISALRDEINVNDERHTAIKREHRAQERSLCDRYDHELSQRRPEYPNTDQLAGITMVSDFIHQDIDYGDHLGFARPQDTARGLQLPASVNYCHQSQRINIYAKAPYAARSTRRLWELTDDELTALRTQIHACGLRIINEWQHEDGIAFTLTSRRV